MGGRHSGKKIDSYHLKVVPDRLVSSISELYSVKQSAKLFEYEIQAVLKCLEICSKADCKIGYFPASDSRLYPIKSLIAVDVEW